MSIALPEIARCFVDYKLFLMLTRELGLSRYCILLDPIQSSLLSSLFVLSMYIIRITHCYKRCMGYLVLGRTLSNVARTCDPILGGSVAWMRVRLVIRRLQVRTPPGRLHSFVEIDHKIFLTVILSLPLIQEGQLSVSGERISTILGNRYED